MNDLKCNFFAYETYAMSKYFFPDDKPKYFTEEEFIDKLILKFSYSGR